MLITISFEKMNLAAMPPLVLLRIADFLSPEDTTRLACTCTRLYSLLPKYLVMSGEAFIIYGPSGGHWAPEEYFKGPALSRRVGKFTAQVTSWKDQGWGNRKGELFVKLMRKKKVLAEKRELFGIAEHHGTDADVEVGKEDPVVALAKLGDHYLFMRNAGGGGGHELVVKGFRVVVSLLD